MAYCNANSPDFATTFFAEATFGRWQNIAQVVLDNPDLAVLMQ